MNGNALGGGILFAVIALLWIAVLVPSFARGREFRAAEQNAARLQRTLRILAETAEVPEEHYLEASAKEAVMHEKKLKIAQKRLKKSRKKELQLLRNHNRIELMKKQRELTRQQVLLNRERLHSAKLKPVRSVAAVVSLLGIIGALVGVGTWIAGLGPLVLIIAGVSAALGVSTLILLAPGARRVPAEVPQPVKKQQPQGFRDFNQQEEAEPVEEDTRAAHEAAQAKAKAAQEAARVLAKVRADARAEAHAQKADKANQPGSMLLGDKPADQTDVGEPVESVVAEPTEADAVSERLQRMGVVGEQDVVNLDEMLKRRRHAG